MSAGRQYLSDREWREMFEAQGCMCAKRGCGNTEGPFEADHENPNYFAPGKPDQILCIPCHREKTRAQAPSIRHTKRLNGEYKSQHQRREERKAKGLPPLLSGPGFRKSRARTAAEIMGTDSKQRFGR